MILFLLLPFFCSLGLQAQSSDLTGIAHVALRVNDLQKSRDFYRSLDFEEAFEFSDEGKVSVAYVKVSDRQFIELIPRTGDSQPGGILHTCFETADIESLHNAHVERGLRPTETAKGRAGNGLFEMYGPDRQQFEYTQYLPGSLHSLDYGNHLAGRWISQHMLEPTTAVRNLAAERAYYTDKLGFESTGSGGNEMYIAGNSRHRLELQSDAANVKPRIVFAVANVRQAEHDLRKRGFNLQKGHHSVSVSDPDGTIVAFVVP
jgi:catechol 2,3-dioxygenase-like lactoylglutathione lyase family enzyme